MMVSLPMFIVTAKSGTCNATCTTCLDNCKIITGQIAEGTYNFTSTSDPSKIAREFEEVPSGSENDDVQILHELPPQMREDVNVVNEGKFSSHNTSPSI